MVRSGLVAGGVAVLAVLAAVHTLAGGRPGGRESRPVQAVGERLRGPDAPAPGALPGRLVFTTGPGCAGGVLDLGTLAVREARRVEGCAGLRPAPPAAGVAQLEEQDLVRGLRSSSSAPVRALGSALRGDGVLAVAVERAFPAALPYGRDEEGGSTFASMVAVSHGGSLPELVLELWHGRQLVEAVELPTVGYVPGGPPLGEIVRFAPGGREVAVASRGGPGYLVVVDLELGRALLGPLRQRGYAWSPDGEWLAVASGDAVAVYGAGRVAPVYVLPLPAEALAWR